MIYDLLFRGYVKTKNKRCLQRFKNTALNSYENVKELDEFAGVIKDDVVLIDVDDREQSELLMDIVEDLQLDCIVMQTTRGKHFYFKNSDLDKCGTHRKLALGLTADIKVGNRNSYAVVKFNGEERFIEWESERLQELPKWLMPINSEVELFDLQEGDGRNQTLYEYILKLTTAGFSKEESRECLSLINRYVFSAPLEERELETIMRDDAFPEETFFSGKTFLFDKFATWLMHNDNICKIDGRLSMYRNGVYVPAGEEVERAMIRHIPTLKAQQRAEVLKYVTLIAEEKKMSDARYIAFANGIYDIVEDRMMPFTSELVMTNMIPWEFNREAESELVDRTLDKIACHDEKVRKLLEECVGYCFFRRNELSKSFLLTGDKSNGKSSFLDMVRNVLGPDNVSALDLNEFDERFTVGLMHGKLANIGDDISDDFMHGRSISSFKKVVSGNLVKGEFKGQDAFFFTPYVKLLFSANDIPRMKDKTGAVLRRLVIVPFNAKFSKNDPDYDPYIGYKLRARECMERLVLLGIQGLRRVIENKGFTECGIVEEAITEYEIENNPILLFLQDSEVDGRPTKDVYREYQVFCSENSYTAITKTSFTKELKRRLGAKVKKVRNGSNVLDCYTLED